MPTVKQLVVIASAIAAAIVGAGTVGISAIERSASQEYNVTQVPTNRITPSKADFRLNDHRGSERSFWAKNTLSCP